MKLITVVTQGEAYFPFLIESCKRHHAYKHLTILGWKQKWQGFNWRNNLVLDFLKDIPNPDEEVVCFIDAYDVILLRDFSTLEETFKKHPKSKTTIIVSIEQLKSIRSKIGALYFGKCQGHSINAGCYIGYASNIHKVLSTIWSISNQNPKADDQVLLANYCRQYPEDITLDTQQEFFSTLVKPFRNIEPSELPPPHHQAYFLHANFFTRLDHILIHQNYDFTPQDSSAITNYIWKNAIKKWWYIYTLEAILYITIIYFILRYVQSLRRRF